MDSTLVILTNRFPYPPGEEFLKAELEVLANNFKKIILIPTNRDISNKLQFIREVPANVQVLNIYHDHHKSTVSRVINVFKTNQYRKWLMDELPRSLKHGLKGPLVMLNWLSIACEIKDKLQKVLDFSESCIYYSYWLTPSAIALAMLKEQGLTGKCVSRVHGGDLYAERHQPAYIPFQGKTIKSLDQTYSISENGYKYLLNKYLDIENKISVQRLGIKPKISEKEINWNKNSEVLRVVSCSYLKPVKRIHLLAEALKHCHFPVEWTHIGDGPERGRIEEIIKELPEQIKVNLLGNKNNDDIMEIYRKADFDLFVNISESEGIPVTIMEAFAFGIPVLATDVGGTSEIVNENNGGLLKKDLQPLDIAANLAQFYSLPVEKRTEKGKSAFKTWNQFYNANKNYTEFAQLLKD